VRRRREIPGPSPGGRATDWQQGRVPAGGHRPPRVPQDAAHFREQIDGKNLPAVIDTGATLSHTYKISAPTTVIVVDPAGKVTYQGHAPSADQILEQLDKAAGK
jgi:hypothetical protein